MKEQIIEVYFNMWVHRDFSELNTIFTEDAYYNECYGPEYYGLNEIKLWIESMLSKQLVLEWSIKRFIHEKNTVAVEWFFKDDIDFVQHEFDGVSIIEFSDDYRISSIKEFESKSEHSAPFHQ